MKTTQYEVIGELISRKRGATPAELMFSAGTTCIHKRLSEMKERGWEIRREPIPGKAYGRYFGAKPQV